MRNYLTRFWSYVDTAGDCWMWTRGVGSHGYGQFNMGSRDRHTLVLAHRFAWELLRGPIPDGMQADHMCGVRRCVNPDHLQILAPSDHSRLGWQRGQMVHHKASRAIDSGTCLAGHDVAEVGIYVYPDGRRSCRACKAANESPAARAASKRNQLVGAR